MGATVFAFASAGTALDFLEKSGERPAVILCDIGMPDEDGYAFIRRLRSGTTEWFKHVPVIALTAYARPEDRERALKLGFSLHLTKPVTSGALLDGIQKVLGPGNRKVG